MEIVDPNRRQFLRSYKIRLFLTLEQEEQILELMRYREYVYNWAIDKEWKNVKAYDEGKVDRKLVKEYTLHKEFTEYKKTHPDDPYVSKGYPLGFARKAINDAVKTFIRWYKKLMFSGGKPRFHSVTNNTHLTLGLRGEKSYILDGRLKTEGIGGPLYIDLFTHKFDGCGGLGNYRDRITHPWYRPRIRKDPDGFYLSFCIYKNGLEHTLENVEQTPPLGIDVGIINTFTLSNGTVYHQPDVTKHKDHIAMLNKDINRLYRLRKKEAYKRGLHVWELPKSSTEKKKVNARIREYKKVHNILVHWYNITIKSIVMTNPEAIVIETVFSRKLSYPNNSPHSHNVYFCMIRYMFEDKCEQYNIPLYEANNNFPSSKTCNKCGCVIEKLNAKRVFICPECGYEADRDTNAADNLRDLYIHRDGDNIRWWNGIGEKLILKDKLTKS